MSELTRVTEYIPIYDSVLRNFVETMFAKEIQEDYTVTELLRSKEGNWVIRLDKDMFKHPVVNKRNAK